MNARRPVTTLATCLLFAGSAAWGQSTYSVTELGTLPGTEWSSPQGASDDGSIVVGYSIVGNLGHGFVWSRSGGMQSLTLPGDDISAAFVHPSGAVVTGQSCIAGYSRCQGVVWTPGGRESLTLPGDTRSSLGPVSADGSVVLAESIASDHTVRSVRWTAGGGLASLGTPPAGYYRAFGNALSADGSIVVGDAYTVGFTGKAVRWSSASGFTLIDPLPGDASSSGFYVSPDGSTVIGTSNYPAGPYEGYQRAFVWTAADGLQALILPGEYRSGQAAVSANGSVIVGQSCNIEENCRPFIWSADTGAVELPSIPGATSSFPGTVSADGTTVTGGACLGGDCVAGWRGWVWTAALGTLELGPLPGDATSQVSRASADLGVVSVNSCDTASVCRAYLWVRPGNVVPLMLPGYSRSYVNAVAKNGAAVVGEACDASYAHCEVFVWTPDGGVEPVNLPGYVTSFTGQDAVSHDGKKIVGGACDENYLICEPFIWTRPGGVEPLGLPSGDMSGWPNGISANGSIAYGESFAVDIAHRQSVVWTLSAPAQDGDADDDGIADSVDTVPATSSHAFSDGEGTSGVITDSAGLSLTIEDVGSPGGVRVVVGAGTGQISLDACGFTETIDAASEVIITCGSVAMNVLEGAAHVLLDDGNLTVISIRAGATGEVTDNGNGTFQVENVGGAGTVSVTVDGVETTIAPGGSQTYTVVYTFTGFFNPVDALPTLNGAKAGSAIPVKFSLGGNQGLAVFAAGYPTSQKIDCSTSAPLDAIEETVTAGSSSLSYDAGADRYHYVWKTDKAWFATCRQLTLTLKDATTHYAIFKFK